MIGRRTTAQLGRASKIRFLSEKIITLPTLPTVAAKLMELVDDPRTSSRSLARLIEGDQVLTARILKLANSPYYGFPRQIHAVPLAVIVTGFDAVKDMGLSVSALDAFGDGYDTPHFSLAKFWEHAFGVGVGARMLAKRFDPAHTGDAFAAGLMHDLGKVVFFKSDSAHYARMFAEKKSENGPDISSLERESFDTDHAGVGALLAKKWGLPLDLAVVIGEHHAPLTNEISLVCAVSLADILAKKMEIGYSGDRVIPADLPAIMARLGLGGEEFEQLNQVAEMRRIEADSFFRM